MASLELEHSSEDSDENEDPIMTDIYNSQLSELEAEAIRALLPEGEEGQVLAAQINAATVVDREFTGVGFFTNFRVPKEIPRLPYDRRAVGHAQAEIDGLRYGAGFVMFVEEGAVAVVECYTYGDEKFPAQVGAFSVWRVEPQ